MAHAEDRIYNYDGSREGTFDIIDTTSTVGYNPSGAIMRYKTTSGATELTGNITLTGSSLGQAGHGVFISAYGENMNSAINLSTGSVNDAITITTSGTDGFSGNGITLYAEANADSSTNTNVSININANAGGELQNLIINSRGYGITSSGGVINVTANTVINSRATGISAGNYAGQTNMAGTLDITASFGIEGTGSVLNDASIIDLSNTSYTKLTTDYEAIYLRSNVKVILGEHLEAVTTQTDLTRYTAVSAYGGAQVEGTGQYSLKGSVIATSGYDDSDSSTIYGSSINLTFTDGSVFEGRTRLETYYSDPSVESNITLEFQKGAKWITTDDSTLNLLTLNPDATIVFNYVEGSVGSVEEGGKEGIYLTSIETASVTLGLGSILAIDIDGSTVNIGDTFTLFTGLADLFDNGGLDYNAKLISADGRWLFTYTNPEDGVFEIIRKTDLFIPEPATATLGLLGLASLLIRRRR